jgi:hypothetical protein
MECVSGDDCLVECVSGGMTVQWNVSGGRNDCSVECASGGSDCSMQHYVSGMRYLMCGGTPWVVPVQCGKKQGPNYKRIKENLGRCQCIGDMGMGPLCGHFSCHKKSQHLQGGC